jgi:hypothetical protein
MECKSGLPDLLVPISGKPEIGFSLRNAVKLEQTA